MSATIQTTNGAATARKTRNRRAKMTIAPDYSAVTFTLFDAEGKPRTDAAATFIARVAPLPADIRAMLAVDRLRNKLMDSYSNPDDDVLEKCRETYDMLMAGQWEASGERGASIGLFAEAYAEHFKTTLEVAREKINGAMPSDDATLKTKVAGIRAHPTIVAIMERIKAARAAERAKVAAATAKTAAPATLGAL